MSELASFRELFETHYGYVRRSLLRLGVAYKDVDDQAQEVFLRVFQKFDQLDVRDTPKPWLFSFALRIASNYRQLRRHRQELLSDQIEAREPGTPEQQLDNQRLRHRVLLALAKLPLKRRAVFIMHEIDQQPAPTIATALELPVNTVYSRLRKARAEFKKAYQAVSRRNG